MPGVKKSGLGKYGQSRKRRRSASVRTRAKWQKPTAKNQKSQILGNAAAISRLRSLLPPPVYCDWQYTLTVPAVISNDGAPTFVQTAWDLMDFANTWDPVLRIATTVNNEVSTRILRMNFNMRYNLLDSDWAQMTVFVVTLRRDAANRNPVDNPLQSVEDFITNVDLQNPRLNPARYKVHYSLSLIHI